MSHFRPRFAAFAVLAFAVLAAAALNVSPTPAAAEAESDAPTLVHERYGERRAYFDDYLAACRPDGYCSVLAYNGAGPDAAGVDADYILRIAAPSAESGYVVEFTGVETWLDEDATVTIAIDGEDVAALKPHGPVSWSRRENVVNEYVFSPDAAGGELVELMKTGERLRVRFTDRDGEARDVAFSLIGLTRALDWIENARFE